MNRSQTGAMFGLDARIALAIFAIMAIVVGYLAWGRIAIARQSVLISEIQSVEEALDGYQTDMGTFFLFTLDKQPDDNDSSEDITALWDKSKVKKGFQPHWNGPYLHRESRDIPPYGRLSLFYATGDRKEFCNTQSDCYVWLSVSAVPAKQWLEINRLLDEGNGASPEPTGQDVSMGRVQSEGATDPRPLYFRTVSRPAQ